MRVLVTGGAGFIGSAVAAHLRRADHEVHIVDRFSYAGKMRNICDLVPSAKLWCGDLKEWDMCVKLADFGFDAVVHLASNTHVDHSITNPRIFTLDNVLATNQLLHALERNTPKRIILYSTDEVYGSTPPGETFAEDTPFNPSNAYSASKVGIEGLARAYHITHHMPIMVVRPCNTYGPRQHPEKVIPRFVGQALRNEPLTVHNDGRGSRDWLHTSDHAAAVEAVLKDGTPGEAYNLAAGEEHTDLDIAERILRITNSASRISFVKGRPGHDRRYWMNGAKIRSLGWRPCMPFNDGFEDAVRWNMEHQDWWSHDHVDAGEMRNG